MIIQILFYLILLLAMAYLMNQVRRPTRWIGQFFLWNMNRSHSALTDWGLQHIPIQADFAILDIGCGGGRTVQKLAGLAAQGRVWGIDYSEGSVAASRATNRPLIEAGRVEIDLASVSQLPFPDGRFDLVTAVETQYYWPNPASDMREVLRVLRPGGTLAVILELYKHSKSDPLEGLVMRLLRSSVLSVGEQRDLFSAAGYTDLQVFEETGKGWLCITGRKPA